LQINFDHIQLAIPANEEAKARAFYRDLLGLQEIEKPDALKARGGCWFGVGTQQFHLGVEADFRPAKKAHPAFRVTHYEDLQQRLEEAGFIITPDDMLEDVERFYTHDPFGNRLEFIREAGSR
jgi:catechol 2,3-dioxygenase-like lactoylglutathione lyase family enzyme